MKTALTVAVTTAIALLSGCSAIQQGDLYSSAVMPTAQTVAEAGGQQRFNSTLFITADFKEDGTQRTFSEYNFATESAPCTVLGDGYKGPSMTNNSTFYKVEKGSEEFLFNCRAAGSGAMRLFLIGSSADCATHGGVNGQMSTFAKALELKCNGYRISRGQPTKTDLAYTQS